MNGFIEVYMDARGMKGAWEGVVYYANHEKTDEDPRAGDARAVVRGSPAGRSEVSQAEGRRACRRRRSRSWSKPATRVRSRRSASTCRTISASARSTAASRCRCRTCSTPTSARCPTASARNLRGTMRRWSGPSGGARLPSELTTEIHEVLGHGSGRMADHITVTPQDLLKEQYSALEETRADLVALYFVADPYLAAIGLVPADEQQAVVQTEYEAYARNALVQLRRVRDRRAARRRSHAQPPGDRALAAGQHPRHRRAARATRRPTSWSSTPTRSATAWRSCSPKCSASSPKATTRRRRSCSKPTACTSIPRCATKSSRASIT